MILHPADLGRLAIHSSPEFWYEPATRLAEATMALPYTYEPGGVCRRGGGGSGYSTRPGRF
jgi:hypothetical protein